MEIVCIRTWYFIAKPANQMINLQYIRPSAYFRFGYAMALDLDFSTVAYILCLVNSN
jgi:hypothetical protein